ncbi:type I-E CRISPR-associated protein Cas6/Cse3/CasE [Kitasatospora brasiliensis]|uniref:type I-E CRISPR-associated protein Cas6/Cse3/CasE n=1 Tax=Kitasatospora brasiliensis TaxID=3058040 RepID=UPI00292E0D2E|nr:type I-E CRISPR-associated protein Cas6/Cse3/CasE [Kitasatospora sp. K002]
MTHLTLLRLEPRSRDAADDLRNISRMHQRIMGMYPDALTSGEAARRSLGVLYRIERTVQSTTVLVQSALTADPTTLPPRYATAQQRNLTPLLDWLADGHKVRYRIDGSPTRSMRDGTRDTEGRLNRGKPAPLHGKDAIAWWERKAHAAGLDLHGILDIPQAPATGHRATGPIRHTLTRFEGIATITDHHALRTAVTDGIGRGLAYGAGLLSIAPHRE